MPWTAKCTMLTEPISSPNPRYESYVTFLYRAPELWPHRKAPGKLLVPAVDVWAFGCSLWELGSKKASGGKTMLFMKGGSECDSPDKFRKAVHGDIQTFLREMSSANSGVSQGNGQWRTRVRRTGAWSKIIHAFLSPSAEKREAAFDKQPELPHLGW